MFKFDYEFKLIYFYSFDWLFGCGYFYYEYCS